MELKLKFNSKSSSPSIKNALKLSERFKPKIVDNTVTVETNELTEDFKKLLEIVAHLSKTEFTANGINIDSRGYKLRQILFCPKVKRCKGECSIDSYQWEEINFLLGLRERDENEMYSTELFKESTFDQFGRNILVDYNTKEFTIDRDSLINSYNENFQLAQIFCPKYKPSKYLEKLSKFNPKQTFQIPEEKPYNLFDEETLEKLNSQKNNEREELINLIGDEVEKRMIKILSELKLK